jgi:hypothetical protein
MVVPLLRGKRERKIFGKTEFIDFMRRLFHFFFSKLLDWQQFMNIRVLAYQSVF